jgi:DNA mismatch repair ATPase MutL
MDVTGSGREDVALATSASSAKLEETVSSVLGHKFLGSLAPLELDLEELLNHPTEENLYNWGITGLISKTPQGVTAAPSRAVNYYCINGRVVELPKLTSLLRKVWNGFGGRKKPSCILCFTLPNDAFDINLSPDKQQVLLTQEQDICQLLQEHVTQYWASQTNGVFQLQQLDARVEKETTLPKEEETVRVHVEEEDTEDGERPQMHKRRFAFVHDLSKAKMQHDLEERQKHNLEDRQRCRGEGEEKKQSENVMKEEHDSESPQQSSPSNHHGATEPSPPKKAKVVSREELTGATSPEDSDMGLAYSRPSRKLSDTEQRVRTAIRTKSNRGSQEDIPSPKAQSAPVTPEDPTPPHGAMTADSRSSHMAQFPVLSAKRRGENAESDSTTRNQKQSSLDQFAFQPASSHTSTEERRRRRERTEVATSENNVQRIRQDVEIASKRVHDDDQESVPSRTSKRPRSPAHLPSEAELKAASDEEKEGNDDNGFGEATTETGAGNQSQTKPISSIPGDDEPPPNGRQEEAPVSSPVSVVWKSFRGTEAVCRSAQLERFHMRRRKQDHTEVRNSLGTKSEVEKEAEDVTKSVGSQESSKSSVISLSKSEFRSGMKVIGQFNLGFILARCNKNHLWILDQHACDEKYNFEQMCRNTVLHEQKLMKPMPLDLSPAEEACILDHMHIFEANGFRFDFKPEAPVRHRLSLTGLPHSGAQNGRKAVQFGKDDVKTLCAILSEGSSYDAGDGGTGTDGTGMHGNNAVRRYASTANSQLDTANRIIARLPKAIAMFASRACRTSIMIGTALSRKEMDKIVQRLADVEHPWNCPHGRPTMRHVGDVLPMFLKDERRAADHITGPTMTVTPMTQEPSAED